MAVHPQSWLCHGLFTAGLVWHCVYAAVEPSASSTWCHIHGHSRLPCAELLKAIAILAKCLEHGVDRVMQHSRPRRSSDKEWVCTCTHAVFRHRTMLQTRSART
eukprot:3704104-Alexandrium_andersonii.AAC.1